MDITRWSIPKSDWLYYLQPKMEKLYTVSKNKPRSWMWIRSQTPYCKFRLKLKKVGKTTRPFRYDLNQIPYKYTVEVRNSFKGLDLIDRVPDELWTEVHDIVQETGIKMNSKKRNVKRQSDHLRRPYKYLWKEDKLEEKEKRNLNAEFQRITRRDKKAFSDQCKEREENNRMD